MKIRFKYDPDVGEAESEIMEFPDNATDNEIAAQAWWWIQQYINLSFYKVEETASAK